MPNKMFKAYPVEVKQVEGKPRTLRFVASTEATDRDGEQLLASGWMFDNLLKNPVFMWVHQYDQPPIGKILNIGVQDGKVVEEVEFADAATYPFADTVYKLYMGGFLNAVSVGFIPIEWETGGKKEGDPKRIYTKQDMLETSAVPVPSNPEALIQARSAKVITAKELAAVKRAFKALSDTPESKSSEVPDKPAHSQGELADEIDYTASLVKEQGLNESNKGLAVELALSILRITGSEIPEDIKQPLVAKMLVREQKACKEAMTACKSCKETLDGHHKAHNAAYKAKAEWLDKCMDNLKAVIGDEPPEAEAEDTKSLISKLLGK